MAELFIVSWVPVTARIDQSLWEGAWSGQVRAASLAPEPDPDPGVPLVTVVSAATVDEFVSLPIPSLPETDPGIALPSCY